MKSMFMTAFFMTAFTLIAQAATVNSSAIKMQANAIGKIALGGVNATKVKGNSVKEMIQDYAMKQGVDAADFEFEANVSTIGSSDEIKWGSATMGAALGLIDESTSYMNENPDENGNVLYSKAKIAKMKDAIRKMVGTGVVFGYNPNGNGVCGMNFTSLLVVDTATKTVYEIDFYGHMEC